MAGGLDESGDYGLSISFQENKIIFNQQNQCHCPGKVKVVNWLKYNLTALLTLFNHAILTKRTVLVKDEFTTHYGLGDALRSGFGSLWDDQVRDKKYRNGTWENNMSVNSSNLRELKNLTETLEILAREGKLNGLKFFIFIENTTSEADYLNVNSSSSALFDCVLKLRLLEMAHRCKIHIYHVSGDIMIYQVADGLSRGDFSEGHIKVRSIFEFIQLNNDALETSPCLE